MKSFQQKALNYLIKNFNLKNTFNTIKILLKLIQLILLYLTKSNILSKEIAN